MNVLLDLLYLSTPSFIIVAVGGVGIPLTAGVYQGHYRLAFYSQTGVTY